MSGGSRWRPSRGTAGRPVPPASSESSESERDRIHPSYICLVLPGFKMKLLVVRSNLMSYKIHLLMFSWAQTLPTGHSQVNYCGTQVII